MVLYVGRVNQQTFLKSSETQMMFGSVVVSHDASAQTITARFPTGWSIRVGLGTKMLHISVNAASQDKNRVSGLLGSFNDDVMDDFMQIPITNLSINASLQEIHEQFGQLCKSFVLVMYRFKKIKPS